MGATEYRQGPNMAALLGAVICFLSGILSIAGIQARQEYIPGSSMVRIVAFGTFILTALLLIIAFSRYRFRHLRKHSNTERSDHYHRYSGRHKQGRHHHKHHHSRHRH